MEGRLLEIVCTDLGMQQSFEQERADAKFLRLLGLACDDLGQKRTALSECKYRSESKLISNIAIELEK
jgi:hypothetical protein